MHTAKLPFITSLFRWLRYFVSLWTTNNSCSPIDTSLAEVSAVPANSACRNRLEPQALASLASSPGGTLKQRLRDCSHTAVVFHAAIPAADRPAPRGFRYLFFSHGRS